MVWVNYTLDRAIQRQINFPIRFFSIRIFFLLKYCTLANCAVLLLILSLSFSFLFLLTPDWSLGIVNRRRNIVKIDFPKIEGEPKTHIYFPFISSIQHTPNNANMPTPKHKPKQVFLLFRVESVNVCLASPKYFAPFDLGRWTWRAIESMRPCVMCRYQIFRNTWKFELDFCASNFFLSFHGVFFSLYLYVKCLPLWYASKIYHSPSFHPNPLIPKKKPKIPIINVSVHYTRCDCVYASV